MPLGCQLASTSKSAIFHSIKPPFDAEVAKKFLNGIYLTSNDNGSAL